ncbi:hypothetical protein C1I98_10970 [Spongiactinospora gelatinilytica]|uniref:HTH cro/C1-type domain-containing protein n=1 Tax=Spongiactinospora gelatinilytica TaxID=2666298 RepID=A0A2W2HHL5_9ACTN|nr:helix-turn-helix transcriptional regulator [Spongiactinospora gelatinilytica]PZG49830.1 hypothetical protein C1I98_10970 [Spongiactinospora gelatinilytica]
MSQDRARAAQHVVARRGELGLTQQQLASVAEIDVKTIFNLESGERWPHARTRARIEAALGWAAGTLTEIAAGRDPRPSASATSARRYAEVWAQKIWEITELTEYERRALIMSVRAMRGAEVATHATKRSAGA